MLQSYPLTVPFIFAQANVKPPRSLSRSKRRIGSEEKRPPDLQSDIRSAANSPFPQPRLNPSRVGELAEAAFLHKAASLGFGVARPWGNSARYDFILDCTPNWNDHRGAPPLSLPCDRACTKRSRRGGDFDFLEDEMPHDPPGAPPWSRCLRQGGDFDFCNNPRECPTSTRRCEKWETSHLVRVQVKCTSVLRAGGYDIQPIYSVYGQRKFTYTARDIDFLVAHIVPLDVWYVLPVSALNSRGSLRFYPQGGCRRPRFEHFREAWRLLHP